MKPQEMKEIIIRLCAYVPIPIKEKYGERVNETIDHIVKLLEAESTERLIITPCSVTPAKKHRFKYDEPIGVITEEVFYQWTTENIYWTKEDYAKAVNNIMGGE